MPEGRHGAVLRILELRSVWGTGGGPEKTILLGAEQTDRRRFAITVCYLRDLRDRIFAIDRRANANVDYVEIHERHSFDHRIWRDLRNLVKQREIDIVHSHDYKTDFLAYLLSRFEPVIALATAHGWPESTLRERLVYDPVDRRFLARFPCVIAVSSNIREALLAAGADPARVRVVLNGIDPDRFRRDHSREPLARAAFGLESDAFVIGAVGRLEPEKRYDILLEAFSLICREHTSMKLLIAGQGSRAPDLRAMAAQMGLDSAVRFLGHADDIVLFHHAINVFVQSSDREGTSNTVLEAMALESPIVATAVGGTGELAKDGEHATLVSPGNPRVLADAILDVMKHREAARRRVIAARSRVEQQLSFEARMKAVESIYEELASGLRGSEKIRRASG
jgi:glycosyltransferase involved in cell wall biosynthesis